MHELSVCQSIITQASEIAFQNQASAIESITLRIGPLSGIETSLLKQAFPFASRQSVAKGAELIVEELPIVIQCNKCGTKTNATANNLTCAQCGDYHTQLISGDEMLLVNVELSREEIKQQEPTKESSAREANHV